MELFVNLLFLLKEKLTSLLNGMLACSRPLRALRAWFAHVLGVLACFTCWRAWRAYVFGVLQKIGVLHKMACLTFSLNGVLGELHNMVCLACFIKKGA